MGLGKSSMRKTYYRELLERQQLLEDQNRQLEEEVNQRRQAQEELKALNEDLEERVSERTAELEASIEELQRTQEYLIQTEKLSALGGLVAGISHEINTPLGIGVTSTSFLKQEFEALAKAYEEGKLKKGQMDEYLRVLREGITILENNLGRAVELIENFKMIATDQSHYEHRTFQVVQYFHSIISNLTPELRRYEVEVQILCDEDLKISGYPGVFSQILTNLVMNALIHGFDKGARGTIQIVMRTIKGGHILEVKDNGKGVDPALLRNIFDPFFTTTRGAGGSGLGMYIVQNLVTKYLGGTITAHSQVGQGFQVEIRF